MAIPSIALIPSGYKAGKLYSVLPTNGNADLTVVRNSTANRINKDGLIESMAVNVPLLDHSNGLCPSLLLQPQSTNLITYPLSFDNAYWTKSGATVVSGQSAPSVDNPTSAFKLVAGVVDEQHKIYYTANATAPFSVSVYAKADGYDRLVISASNLSYSVFNLTSGTVSSYSSIGVSERIIESIGNGWYRCTVVGSSNSGSSVSFNVYNADLLSGNPTFIGDGTSGIYIFGAQLEQQSYATSLMLPNAEGSTTTRLKDEVSKSGLSGDINSVEGVLFVEMATLANDGVEKRFGIQKTGTFNTARLTYTPTSNQITAVLYNGSSQASLSYVVTDTTDFHKIAFKYQVNNFALWVDGIERATDLSGTTFEPNYLDELAFDLNGAAITYGKVKSLQVFKTALTDAELAALTTI